MVQLSDYYTLDDSTLSFTRDQASQFAKQVAGDFNPIHDPEHKRFCVPGDLLFTVFICEFGLSKEMCFSFSGMVNDSSRLNFSPTDKSLVDITDNNDKKYLSVQRSSDISTHQQLIDQLACQYVQFSGHTFPHILVPLMSEQNVMINPDRPLVIYEKMAIHLDTFDIDQISLETTNSTLEVKGKRGTVSLEFAFKANGEVVGSGKKSMLLSGLREYNAEKMQQVVDNYDALKSAII